MVAERNDSHRERAPLLRVFGVLAPRVAALVRARPGLVARLVVAPREAVHAMGAYLHLAPGAALADTEVAVALDGCHPRDLLRAALPGCPPRLYRVLDRAGDRVRERAFYQRLGEAVLGPCGGALLDGEGPLDDRLLDYFRMLGAMDPLVASVRKALPGGIHHLEAVETMVALLKAHGALRGGDLDLPPGAGTAAVAKRLRRALGRIPAPDPGFAVPPPYRLVGTAAELHRIGKVFKNCLRPPDWQATKHHLGHIDGSEVFLIADEPPLVVGMRRAAPGVWTVQDMAGPGNAAAPEGARDALLRGLAAAGARVVGTDPATALTRLENKWLAGRYQVLDDGGDGDGEEPQRDAA